MKGVDLDRMRHEHALWAGQRVEGEGIPARMLRSVQAGAYVSETLPALLDELEQRRTQADPDYRVINGWLAVAAGGCTCGGGDGAHEPGCGWEPIRRVEDLLRDGPPTCGARRGNHRCALPLDGHADHEARDPHGLVTRWPACENAEDQS